MISLETSPTVRRLVGRQPKWAFIWSKSTMRIEYHVGKTVNGVAPRGEKNDGFKMKYLAWPVLKQGKDLI